MRERCTEEHHSSTVSSIKDSDNMATNIELPELGDGIESGEVSDVLVSEGDVIEKGQGLVEIESDKASVVVPTEIAGTVVKLCVAVGDTIAIGGVIAQVEESAAPATSIPLEPASSIDAPSPEAPEPSNPTPPLETRATAAATPARPVSPPSAVTSSPPTANAPTVTSAVTDLIPAGPSVRRFAREVGVDLRQLQGTGSGGRITRDDVLSVVRSASKTVQSQAKKDNRARDDWGIIRVEKMPKIRKTIAMKMEESWSTVPRVTNFDDADVTDLEQIRQSSKQDYINQGVKLTTLPFLLKAVAMSLVSNPTVNASIDVDAGNVTYKEYVNIGIAVDSERGLVVPCLRDVEELSIPDIARGIAELADKVREGNYGVDDLRGGTFTVSNLGAIGGTYSTPIINVPEVAVLLIGRARKMPAVVDGDRVAVRLMMPLSLSYDHRLVDGATAARFLNEVIGYLESPSRLLLAP